MTNTYASCRIVATCIIIRRSTLGTLGRRSTSISLFPGLQVEDYTSGHGKFPGKLSLMGDKQCHIDYEVDTDFEVKNIVGATDGRVGILYLAGEGEFVVVDDKTNEEHRVEVSKTEEIKECQ